MAVPGTFVHVYTAVWYLVPCLDWTARRASIRTKFKFNFSTLQGVVPIYWYLKNIVSIITNDAHQDPGIKNPIRGNS